VKGIGEAGTIASTVTAYNAVVDALEPFGVKSLRMPFTPERVWQAIQGHSQLAKSLKLKA
jgi:carbon-monoxide dehydrogenase large subunit